MYLQINAWILPRRYAPRQDDVFTLFNELVGHNAGERPRNFAAKKEKPLI